jgi:hypothetical protein
MQNIFAPDLFQRRRNPKLKEHDAYILQNRGICPAILAADLDVTERFVVSRQRKLGTLSGCRAPEDEPNNCRRGLVARLCRRRQPDRLGR